MGFSPPKSKQVYLSLKLGGVTAPLMDGNIWWGLLSSIWTWVSCSSEQCCRVFSLQQDFSSRRLIYSDKLDLIHRLLSSIYLATGLCHPIDIRTECWYQISYSGHKSYGWGDWNVMWSEDRYFTALRLMNTTLGCVREVRHFCFPVSGLGLSHMLWVFVFPYISQAPRLINVCPRGCSFFTEVCSRNNLTRAQTAL